MVVAAQVETHVVAAQQLRDGRAIGHVVRQRIVAERDDPLAGTRRPHLLFDPLQILAPHRTVGHLHVGARREADEEVAARTERQPTVVAEQAAEGRAGTLRPRRLVVAGHGEPRLAQTFEDSVHAMQFGVAAHVAEIARDQYEIDRRGVDLGHGGPQQRVGLAAGRHVHVGQKGEIELRSAGCDVARSAAGLHAGAQQQGRSEQQRDLLFHIRNLFPAR